MASRALEELAAEAQSALDAERFERLRHVPDCELDEMRAAVATGDEETQARLQKRWQRREQFAESSTCYTASYAIRGTMTDRRKLEVKFGGVDSDCSCVCVALDSDELAAYLATGDGRRSAGAIGYVAQQLHNDPTWSIVSWIERKETERLIARSEKR